MSFEYKSILDLSVAPDFLRDTDFVEAHRPGETYSWRFSGAQLRGLEKAERVAADNILVNRLGLIGANWSFPDLSGTNYLYNMGSETTVVQGLIILDSAIKVLEEALLDIPPSYVHPTGFTNQPQELLSGASIISGISVSGEGHVEGVFTRNLVPADIGAEPSLPIATEEGTYLYKNKTWKQITYSEISGTPNLTGYVTLSTAQTIEGLKTFQNATGVWIRRSLGNPSIFNIAPPNDGVGVSRFHTLRPIANTTGSWTWVLPNKSGTLLTDSDIPDLSGYAQLTGDNYFTGVNMFYSPGGIYVGMIYEGEPLGSQLNFRGNTGAFSSTSGTLTSEDLTGAHKTWYLPNKTGTLATTNDIPDLTNYVTKTGNETISGDKDFIIGHRGLRIKAAIDNPATSDYYTHFIIKPPYHSFSPAPAPNGILTYAPLSTESVTWTLPAKSGTILVDSDLPAAHPTYTVRDITLSGATVLASFESDAIGSVTNITTRTLTAANIGAESTLPTPGEGELYLYKTKVWQAIDYTHIANRPTNLVTTDTAQDITAVKTFTSKIKAIGLDLYKSSDATKIVTLSAAPTLVNSLTFYLPIADGTVNQAMITDGNGYLGWRTIPSTITQLTASASKMFYSDANGDITEFALTGEIGSILVTNTSGLPSWRSGDLYFTATAPIVRTVIQGVGGVVTLNFSHLNTAGNKHIPAGGESGNILVWSADGTATWGVGGGGGATALSQLSDVSLGTLVTGNVLQWDGTNWINSNVPGISHDRLHTMTNSSDHIMSTERMIGRTSSGSGAPEELTAANVLTFIGVTETDWKNENITQPQIEAKLTGPIITHTHDYDKYTSWSLAVDGITEVATISSGNTVTFKGGTNVSLEKSGSTITINATSDSSGSTWLRANEGTLLSGNLTLLNGNLIGITQNNAAKSFSINHSAVAVPSNAINSGNTVIQSLTFDGYGHIASISTATLSSGMVYPSAGIAISTGTAWGTSISNGTGFLKNNGSGTWSYDSNTYSLNGHTHAGLYDNYGSWGIKVEDAGAELPVTNTTTLTFKGTGSATITRSNNIITINAASGSGGVPEVPSGISKKYLRVRDENDAAGWEEWQYSPGTDYNWQVSVQDFSFYPMTPGAVLNFNIGTGIEITHGYNLSSGSLDIQFALYAGINLLNDVTITSAQPGQFLRFSNGVWVNEAFAPSMPGHTHHNLYYQKAELEDMFLALDNKYVPLTRTITINGIPKALDANVSWAVGTVTSVLAGNGIHLTGSPTSSMTLAIFQELLVENEIGELVITQNGLGVALGESPTKAASGTHTHAQLHNRSHPLSSTSDHTATAHRLFYSNASGYVVELAFGTLNKILFSGGTSSAPKFMELHELPDATSIFNSQRKGLVPASPTVGRASDLFLSAAGTWLTPAGTGEGMANPMEDVGDLIIGSTDGSPIKLPIGAANKVLMSNGTTASWETMTGTYSHPNHSGDVTSVSDGATALQPSAITGKNDASALADSNLFLISQSGELKKATGTQIKAFINPFTISAQGYMIVSNSSGAMAILAPNTGTTKKLLTQVNSISSWEAVSFTDLAGTPSGYGSTGNMLKSTGSALDFYAPGSLHPGNGLSQNSGSYNPSSSSNITFSIDTSIVSQVGHTHALSALPQNVPNRLLGIANKAEGSVHDVHWINLQSGAMAKFINQSTLSVKLENEQNPKVWGNLNMDGGQIQNSGDILPPLNNPSNHSVGGVNNRFNYIWAKQGLFSEVVASQSVQAQDHLKIGADWYIMPNGTSLSFYYQGMGINFLKLTLESTGNVRFHM